MSIQNIQSHQGGQAQIQSAEQYKIRAKSETQQAEEIQAQQIQQQNVDESTTADMYDKANPVGEEVEGIYSVSHDEQGNLKIDYKQPESDKQTMSVKANDKTEDSGKAGGVAPTATTNDEDDDDDEEEIEKLKKQRDSIKQQLNNESDEKVKAQLRLQLQSIELQIALKSAE